MPERSIPGRVFESLEPRLEVSPDAHERASSEPAPSKPASSVDGRADGFRLRTLRTAGELAAVREAWAALAQHPWSDPDYVTTCLPLETGFRRPHVPVVEEDGRPRGILIGSLFELDVAWKVGSHRLVRPRARMLRFAPGGLLGVASPVWARALARELLASLDAGEADLLLLRDIDPGAPLVVELERRCRPLQRDPFLRPSTGWVLDLPDSFAAFRQGLSKKTRANLNHTINRMQREFGGDLHVACYRHPEDLVRLMTESEQVARTTYHRRAGVGFVNTPEAQRVLHHALGAGWLRSYVLHVGSQPIAFNHGLGYGATFFGRHTGFDPEYAEFRPGIFLLARVIEDLCAEGRIRHLDFGVMDGDFKRSFASGSCTRASVHVFAPRGRGRRLACMRRCVGALEFSVRALLGPVRARRLSRGLFRGKG